MEKKMDKAKKTMIYLDEAVHTAIKEVAWRERVSMAEFIRRALAEYMKGHITAKRAWHSRRKAGAK
jgi:predicted HicB family RNase H-like nuclease